MTSISSEKRYLRRKKIKKCKYEDGDSGRERNTERHGARYHDGHTERGRERERQSPQSNNISDQKLYIEKRTTALERGHQR